TSSARSRGGNDRGRSCRGAAAPQCRGAIAQSQNSWPRSPLVLIAPAPPGSVLVAAARCAVEPLIHAPEAIQPARVRGIRVVDDAILERECAHSRGLAHIGRQI